MTVGNISDTTVGNQPDCLRISSSTSAISPLIHIDLFIRVGGETRSHRNGGFNTPVLAPGKPEA